MSAVSQKLDYSFSFLNGAHKGYSYAGTFQKGASLVSGRWISHYLSKCFPFNQIVAVTSKTISKPMQYLAKSALKRPLEARVNQAIETHLSSYTRGTLQKIIDWFKSFLPIWILEVFVSCEAQFIHLSDEALKREITQQAAELINETLADYYASSCQNAAKFGLELIMGNQIYHYSVGALKNYLTGKNASSLVSVLNGAQTLSSISVTAVITAAVGITTLGAAIYRRNKNKESKDLIKAEVAKFIDEKLPIISRISEKARNEITASLADIIVEYVV